MYLGLIGSSLYHPWFRFTVTVSLQRLKNVLSNQNNCTISHLFLFYVFYFPFLFTFVLFFSFVCGSHALMIINSTMKLQCELFYSIKPLSFLHAQTYSFFIFPFTKYRFVQRRHWPQLSLVLVLMIKWCSIFRSFFFLSHEQRSLTLSGFVLNAFISHNHFHLQKHIVEEKRWRHIWVSMNTWSRKFTNRYIKRLNI